MYMLDTNTLIYYFKNMGQVSESLLQVSPEDIAIPSIVVYELNVGIAKSQSPQKRLAQLAQFTSVVDIIPFAEDEAKEAAILRASLEKIGTPIGPYDLLIAGTAIAHNATLVTHNIKEFRRVKNLKLVDWY
jgi:tRNA(fMet)-specific endonuclease VapC